MPRKTAKQKPEDPQWFLDDSLWLDLLQTLADNDDSQAERVAERIARLFHRLAKELAENGRDGAYRVRCCLENGRRVIFPYTRFANDCKLLFIESLDEPEPVTLAGAMERKRFR